MPSLLPSVLILTLLLSTSAFSAPNYSAGALIFKVNCSQCHGALGLGDGYFPELAQLGNTNLLDITQDRSPENLTRAISPQSLHKNMRAFNSIEAPLNSVLVDFLKYYYRHPLKSFNLLNKTITYKLADYFVGEATYKRRCTVCHGIQGDGKGQLAQIINDSSPFDLRISHLSDNLLRQIIKDGDIKQGQKLSNTMPGFKDEISSFELDSVMLYVKAFRTDQQL